MRFKRTITRPCRLLICFAIFFCTLPAHGQVVISLKKSNMMMYLEVRCSFFPPGKRAVVGYEDGTVRVWDLKQGNAIHVIKG